MVNRRDERGLRHRIAMKSVACSTRKCCKSTSLGCSHKPVSEFRVCRSVVGIELELEVVQPYYPFVHEFLLQEFVKFVSLTKYSFPTLFIQSASTILSASSVKIIREPHGKNYSCSPAALISSPMVVGIHKTVPGPLTSSFPWVDKVYRGGVNIVICKICGGIFAI